MKWIPLTELEQIQTIKISKENSIIFKHSTRCSISMMAKKKFELDGDAIPENTPVYYLDLLSYRNMSNAIAEVFQIHHQSPQLLVIKDGECIFEATHGEISAEEAAEQLT